MVDTSRATNGVYRGALLYVWLGLMAATVLSWRLGTDREISSEAARNILLLVLAFIKIRYIGLYFMELKTAPLLLRALFEFYCAIVCIVLVNLYLFV